MAKSETFSRLKDQVPSIVVVIPESTITTDQSIVEPLAVMASPSCSNGKKWRWWGMPYWHHWRRAFSHAVN